VAADRGSWLPPRSFAVVAYGHMVAWLGDCVELICTIQWSSI
jgi:hypothetical protein